MSRGQREAYFRRFHWILLSIIASVEFVRGAIFIALIPLYVPQHLNADAFLAGAIMSSMSGADTISKPSAGWLVDFFGPRTTLLVSLPCAMLGLSTFLWSKTIFILIIGAVLFGLGCSPVWPAVLSILVELSPSDEKAETLSAIFMVWLTGLGSGVILVYLLYHFGPRLLIFSLLCFFCIPLGLTLNIRKWISKRRTHRGSGAKRHLLQILREAWKFRVLLPGAIAQTLALGMLLPLLVPFIVSTYGLGLHTFGWLMGGAGIVTVVLLVPVGKMVDRFGYLPFLTTGFIMASALLLAISRYTNHLLIFPYALLLGVSYCLILPSWNGLLAHLLPSSVRASLYSILMSIEGLGMAAGPIIGGKLGVAFGYRFVFGVSAAILLIMAIFYLLLRYPVNPAPGPEQPGAQP